MMTTRAHEQARAHLAHIEELLRRLHEARGAEDEAAEEAAKAEIEELPLEVLVRSGWRRPGEDLGTPEEYQIVLSTGGPAVRVTGALGRWGNPSPRYSSTRTGAHRGRRTTRTPKRRRCFWSLLVNSITGTGANAPHAPRIAATSTRCGVSAPTRRGGERRKQQEGSLMVWTRDRIHDATGFDNGDLFRSAEEVREYFTVANITEMFGECPYTQAELDEMAEEVIRHRWHMVLPVEEYRTVYTDVFGVQLEAIQLPWSVVRSILGREHRGTAEDDALLVDYLFQSGAPEWVRDAEGWVDEHGWGLIGPDVAGEE